MINFDIQDFKKSLASMSYAERREAYQSIFKKLDAVPDEVYEIRLKIYDIQRQDFQEQADSVWHDISKEIKCLIENHQIPQNKIHFNDERWCINITIPEGDVDVSIGQYMDDGWKSEKWAVTVLPQFVDSHKWRSNFVVKLACPYQFHNDAAIVFVEDKDLVTSFLNIFTKIIAQ